MKKHNGGAVTIKTDIINDPRQKDFHYSSSFANIWIIVELFRRIYGHVSDLVTPALTYDIYQHQTSIRHSIFEENYSGGKGSAIFLKQ